MVRRRSVFAVAAGMLAAALLVPGPASAERPPCKTRPLTLGCAGERAGLTLGVGHEPRTRAEDRLAARQFNAVTLQGSLLWPVVHPAPGRWEFGGADRSIAWARRRGLQVTATHFVWDQITYQSTPAWVKRITDPRRLRAVMEAHLRRISRRYGGAIDRWIAVNEPLRIFPDTGTVHETHFSRVLGSDWIAESFRIADRAAPRSSLWLNEIFTEFDARKANALVRLARSLVARRVPIDGVGLQGHLFTPTLQPERPDGALVRRTLRRLAALGLEVAFTEIDAPTFPDFADRLQVQARRIKILVDACLAVQGCTGVTFWDLQDDRSWLADLFRRDDLAPTLFSGALRPKPAVAAVRSALREGARRVP